MKDKKIILKFQIISFFVVSILGTLLHFTYEWSGENALVGMFSAVNESTWEHLKLLFFPMLIMTIIGHFSIGKDVKNILCAKTIGILTSIIFTVIFFYTFSGIVGEVIDIVNIISFFVAVLLGEYVSYRIMLSYFSCNKKISIIVLVALLICFVIFTYKTPNIGLFEDPINGTYGILKKI